MPNNIPNSTDYEHPNEPNLVNLHKALEYNQNGEPHLRVKVDAGTVTVTEIDLGVVEISNDEGNPIPVHAHLYDESDNEYTASNPLTVDGTVELGTTSLSALENINANVTGTVNISTMPNVTVNQPVAVTDNDGSLTVDGTVDIGNEVAINDGGNVITVDGSVSASVSGTVSVDNFPASQTVDGTVNIGTMPDVTINQPVAVTDNGGSLTVDGAVTAQITGSMPVGSNKPFYLEIQQGLIPGHAFNHKFGAAPSMAAGTATVWDVDDTLYPWDALGSGSIINVERNDTDDTGYIVTVQGLDENYEFAEENITITGANQTGSQLFKRVNRAFISDTGSTNEGNIDIEAGAAGGTTVARITAGYGQTLMAVYTIPAGKTAYLINMACTGSSDTDASGSIRKREFEQDAFRIQHAFELQIRGGQYNYTFGAPLVFSEKTDIEIRIVNRSNNKRITAAFDVLLVDNA